MAQTNYTPISLYYSTTASATPSAGNLVNGELAINIQDGKLFYKDAAGVVQTIASKGTGTIGGSNTQVQYNSSGAFAGSANMTFNGTSLTLANDASISGLTVGKGGGAVATGTAFGYQALNSNSSGTVNTAIGYQAGYTNTTNALTAVGYRAGYLYNTGLEATGSVFVGYSAGSATTTGHDNTFVGGSVATANTSGSYNTALGNQALQSNTTASYNTAVGYQAGYSNQTGSANTFIGYQAGYSTTSTSGANTFVGYTAGTAVTTGANNTIIGRYSGNQGGLDIRTSSNYIVLSDGDGNPRGFYNGASNYWLFKSPNNGGQNLVFDGSGLYLDKDNTASLGFSTSYRWSVVYAATGTIQTSDKNLKQNIEDLSDAEKRVAVKAKSLIKKYRFIDAVEKKGDLARIHIGLVAQDLATVFTEEGLDVTRYALFCSDDSYTLDGETKDSNGAFYTKDTPNAVKKTVLGIRYEELLAFIISAI